MNPPHFFNLRELVATSGEQHSQPRVGLEPRTSDIGHERRQAARSGRRMVWGSDLPGIFRGEGEKYGGCS